MLIFGLQVLLLRLRVVFPHLEVETREEEQILMQEIPLDPWQAFLLLQGLSLSPQIWRVLDHFFDIFHNKVHLSLHCVIVDNPFDVACPWLIITLLENTLWVRIWSFFPRLLRVDFKLYLEQPHEYLHVHERPRALEPVVVVDHFN